MTQENKTKKETLDVNTVADKIWNGIKDTKIEMFALPAKHLKEYVKVMPIDPSKLYLSYNIPALFPALEEALGSKYKVEMVDKYLVVSFA